MMSSTATSSITSPLSPPSTTSSSPVLVEKDDDDDDDMAELFSFASSSEDALLVVSSLPPTSITTSSTSNNSTTTTALETKERFVEDSTTRNATTIVGGATTRDVDSDLVLVAANINNSNAGLLPNSPRTTDSLLLQDEEEDEDYTTVLDWQQHETGSGNPGCYDSETLEFLAFLNEPSTDSSSTAPPASPQPAITTADKQEEETEAEWNTNQFEQQQKQSHEQQPDTTVTKDSSTSRESSLVTETVASSASLPIPQEPTAGSIESHLSLPLDSTNYDHRADLYCQWICGKSLQQIQASSRAEAFVQQQQQTASTTLAPHWIRLAADRLGPQRTRPTNHDKTDNQNQTTEELYHLLVQYFQTASASEPSSTSTNTDNTTSENDTTVSVIESDYQMQLLPAVAATLLASGMPVAVVHVVLPRWIPACAPLLAFSSPTTTTSDGGRLDDAQDVLFQDLHHLACYHLPLLVYHLDRYLPGWQFPRQGEPENKTNDTDQRQRKGQIPPCWLLSLLAGEWQQPLEYLLPTELLLTMWDKLLSNKNEKYVCFFLVLSVLERAADDWILLTGRELEESISKSFSATDNITWLREEWWDAAMELKNCTPESILQYLQSAEDRAVEQALQQQRERTEAALQARLAAEAKAHQEAQEKKADEARLRLTRARLVAFYRKHAPDKEGNIDTIMETYADRFEILDAKLVKKYGEGFKPPLPPKPKNEASRGTQANKLLATMNSGLGSIRQQRGAVDDDAESDGKGRVETATLKVSPEEVLPIVCWSREAVEIRGLDRRTRLREAPRVPLRFYLIDSRSHEAAEEQGRFPTALNLGPEAMYDPEQIRRNEEMFESLRSAAHIVVMGEGYAALPELYGQKLTPKLEAAVRQDEARTNICALFFIKKGFPFVSVLDGGFAAAHAWLIREGPKKHLQAREVLVDYDPNHSLFAQMERLRVATATEKAQRSAQNLLDRSLVVMTRRAQQLERMAGDIEKPEGRNKNPLRFFGGAGKKGDSSQVADSKEEEEKNKEKAEGRFRNPLSRSGSSVESGDENEEPRFRNPFGRSPKTLESTAEAGDASLGTDGEREASTSAASNEPPPTAPIEETSPFRNPFGRKRVEEDGITASNHPNEVEETVTFAAEDPQLETEPQHLQDITTAAEGVGKIDKEIEKDELEPTDADSKPMIPSGKSDELDPQQSIRPSESKPESSTILPERVETSKATNLPTVDKSSIVEAHRQTPPVPSPSVETSVTEQAAPPASRSFTVPGRSNSGGPSSSGLVAPAVVSNPFARFRQGTAATAAGSSNVVDRGTNNNTNLFKGLLGGKLNNNNNNNTGGAPSQGGATDSTKPRGGNRFRLSTGTTTTTSNHHPDVIPLSSNAKALAAGFQHFRKSTMDRMRSSNNDASDKTSSAVVVEDEEESIAFH